MIDATGSEAIGNWPEESREAASLVIEKYGAPDEATDTGLTWQKPDPWKRMVAPERFHEHDFPVPDTEAVQSFLDYPAGTRVRAAGSGEAAARGHDEEANMRALNLMHDIVTGARNVEDAGQDCAKEFAGYRRKLPTP